MSKIVPIETKYAGRYFRSRLEARWAIWFDVMNIRWEYENQGFSIGDDRYLPDFELPDFNCYVEIKPAHISHEDEERIWRIMKNWNGSSRDMELWVILGSPAFGQYKVIVPQKIEHLKESNPEPQEIIFACCRKCGGLWWENVDGCSWGGKCADGCLSDKHTTEYNEIGKAFDAAMSAKFDHKGRL